MSPGQTPSEIEAQIVALQQRPDWEARKLAVLLEREGRKLPVITVHRVLLRHGLVSQHDRRRSKAVAELEAWSVEAQKKASPDAASLTDDEVIRMVHDTR
jgi:hypothetical protein